MKKEVILAIVIGFGLGLVITFGIWVANRSLKNLGGTKPATSPETVLTSTPSPNPSPTTSTGLTISTPADEVLVADPNIKVTGNTAKGNTVIVMHENGQDSVTADDNGNFIDSVKLVGGYNTITVISVSPTGEQVSKTLTVTYTTAKL